MRYLFILIFVLFSSCSDEVKDDVVKNAKEVDIDNDQSFSLTQKKIRLHEEAKKVIENWQEYQAVAEFILKFDKTSTKEALLNSNQFYELTTFLKDSIRIKNFKKSSVKVRLNVLNNEALRLFDMDSIPSITNKEVIQEVNKIANAFNALNIKINNVIKRDLLVKDLSGFNHLFEKEDSLKLKPLISPKLIKKIKSNKKKQKLRNKRIKNKRIKPLAIKK